MSWVAVAYLLAMAAFLPIFGRLADMVGRKLLYTGGFLIFVLGSALCGLAPNLPVLTRDDERPHIAITEKLSLPLNRDA